MEALNKTSGITLRCTETILECPLCMELFESPRILPCQHTFCKECLTQLITNNCLDSSGRINKRSFPCPICRRECKLFKRDGVVPMADHLKGFPEHRLLVDLINNNDERNIINNNSVNCVEAESQTEGRFNETNPNNEDTEYLIHKTLCHYYLLLYIIYYYLENCDYLQNRFILGRPAHRDIFLNTRLNATLLLDLRYAICWLRCVSSHVFLYHETKPLDVFLKPNEFDKLKQKNKWQHIEKVQCTIEDLIYSSGLDDVINSDWHEQLRSQMDNYQWYENTRDVATQTDNPKSVLSVIWTFIGRFCLLVLSHLLFTNIFSIVWTIPCLMLSQWPLFYADNMKENVNMCLWLCVVFFINYWYDLFQNWWAFLLLCVVLYIVVWLIISPFLKEWKILCCKDFATFTIPIQNSISTYKRIVHIMCFVENVLRFYVITHSFSIWYEPLINMFLFDIYFFIHILINKLFVFGISLILHNF